MSNTTRSVLSWSTGITVGLLVAVALGGLVGPFLGAVVAIGVKTLLLAALRHE